MPDGSFWNGHKPDKPQKPTGIVLVQSRDFSNAASYGDRLTQLYLRKAAQTINIKYGPEAQFWHATLETLSSFPLDAAYETRLILIDAPLIQRGFTGKLYGTVTRTLCGDAIAKERQARLSPAVDVLLFGGDVFDILSITRKPNTTDYELFSTDPIKSARDDRVFVNQRLAQLTS